MALSLVDLWERRQADLLRRLVRYREDKVTHQIAVRTAADVEAVAALCWIAEAVAWGRKQR